MNQALASTRNSRFIHRLGPHHFAYLRAIAESLDANASAQRFLGVTHGHERRSAHHQLIDTVRAIARRCGERDWRLVGMTIRAASPGAERPTLQAFIDARGLDGWSENEQVELLEAAFPIDRRSVRRDRLRQRQIDLLRRLEHTESHPPRPSDLVSDWFDEVTARRLIWAGHNTLADLSRVIAVGGKWFRSMPGVGETKARRIAAHLLTLIPAALPPEQPFFPLRFIEDAVSAAVPPPLSASLSSWTALPQVPTANPVSLPASSASVQATFQPGHLPSPTGSLLDAHTDMQAVKAWLQARCSSEATAKCYLREARRLMLWLSRERIGRTFASMRVEDCLAYQSFLQHIPPGWMTRDRHTPGQIGWAPFRGPLTPASQKQATTILGALFAWLAAAKYIQGNPWLMVNNDTGSTDQTTQALDTKSISDGALEQIQRFIRSQPPSPSVHRIAFIVSFIETVGLRSSELVNAKLGDFSLQPEGWTLRVVGKGSKTRTVFVPRPAFVALQTYLAKRGLVGIETAPPDAPLLASAVDCSSPVGYQALYVTVKRWFAKAISASSLSSRERNELAGATTHWLRHTFGTRAVARDVPYDVIQQQLGHSSVNTTMNIYGRAPLKRRAEELGRAFG